MSANRTCAAQFTANTPPPPPAQQFLGISLTGMEMGYWNTYWHAATYANGPASNGSSYPIFKTALIDYFASKKVGAFRFLLSWEAMQPNLYDPIPNSAANANFRAYFNQYKAIVDYATSKGIQVIIEPWEATTDDQLCGACWNGWPVGSTTVPVAAFADFWSKMASVYKDNPLVSYGLINEPNNNPASNHDPNGAAIRQSTMAWFQAAQAAITAIRNTGSTQRIYVPGNCWTAASDWTSTWCDAASPPVSNATAWLTVNNGTPLYDPLHNIAIEVHTYLDSDQSGNSSQITSVSAARNQIATTLDWARQQGLKVYLGEMGFCATAKTTSGGYPASTVWADFINYFNANSDTFLGHTWWAGGDPAWWNDPCANGGGHFSVSPTSCNGTTCSGDTANMLMIQNDFK
jgi:endoglucanase